MKYFILLQLTFLSGHLFSQQMFNPSDYCFGGSGEEIMNETLKLSNGNLLLIGSSTSGLSGNKTTPNYGNQDGWVVCLDQSYNVIWELNVGGNLDDRFRSGFELTDGSILLMGNSASGASGNKTSTNFGGNDAWILKVAPDGTVIWDKNFGGSQNDGLGSKIIELNDGSVIVPMSSSSNISGNKTLNGYGGSDIWLIKIDQNGNIIDEGLFGGTNSDAPIDLLEIDANKFSLICTSSSGISGNKATVGYGLSDAWIILLDSNLNDLNQYSFGGDWDEMFFKQLLKTNGDMILVGSSYSGVSGNKTSGNYGENDVWVLHVDSNFNILNDLTFGGTLTENASEAVLVENENILVFATSNSDSNEVKTENRIGWNDNWLLLLDGNLTVLFDETIGTAENDAATSIFESNSELILTSTSMGGANNDKTCAGFGGNDFWVYYSNSSLNINQKDVENFDVYPNPSTGKINLSSAKYQELKIYSNDGKLVSSQQIDDKQIDLSYLLDGFYYLQLDGKTVKLIVQH